MSERRKLRWGQFTIGFLLLVMAACAVFSAMFLQSSPAHVSGIVTLNGQPLGDGEIVFESATGAKAKCKLDQSGQYSLRMKTGEYTVAIQSPTLPIKYSSAQTSGLAAFVMEGKKNYINLELAN